MLESRVEHILTAYYSLRVLRWLMIFLYFTSEILLVLLLVLLPIQIAFEWLISSVQQIRNIQSNIDIFVVSLFLLHVFLYLDYRALEILNQPRHVDTIVVCKRVFKGKWVRLFSLELVCDVGCFLMALLMVSAGHESKMLRIIELAYLTKIYKLIVFHNICTNLVLNTPIQIVYNLLYCLSILFIIVSYVGCAFYVIDYALYHANRPYDQLLWIVYTPAVSDLIDKSFIVQLQYTLFWSLGTASTAAYGNISAAYPNDVIFNIFCLFFEGFIFGFYLSRVRDLPKVLQRKENSLLETFEQFHRHKKIVSLKVTKNSNANQDNESQGISRELYFQILCSLEYQQSRQKNRTDIESILAEDYLNRLKMSMYSTFLTRDLAGLLGQEQLQHKLARHIEEIATQLGENVYSYPSVQHDDLLFLKNGKIEYQMFLDNCTVYRSRIHSDQCFGLFSFITQQHCPFRAMGRDYCTVYHLSRRNYKACCKKEQLDILNRLFQEALAFNTTLSIQQPIYEYNCMLTTKDSTVRYLNPRRNAVVFSRIIHNSSLKQNNTRQVFKRREFLAHKKTIHFSPKHLSFGVQTDLEDKQIQLQQVYIDSPQDPS